MGSWRESSLGQSREKSEPRVVLLFAEHGAWVTPGRGDDSGWEALESVANSRQVPPGVGWGGVWMR